MVYKPEAFDLRINKERLRQRLLPGFSFKPLSPKDERRPIKTQQLLARDQFPLFQFHASYVTAIVRSYK